MHMFHFEYDLPSQSHDWSLLNLADMELMIEFKFFYSSESVNRAWVHMHNKLSVNLRTLQSGNQLWSLQIWWICRMNRVSQASRNYRLRWRQASQHSERSPTTAHSTDDTITAT